MRTSRPIPLHPASIFLIAPLLLIPDGCQLLERSSPPNKTPSGWVQTSLPDPLSELGRQIFTDTRLSQPNGQSCASCHQAEHAFAEPMATSLGATPTLSGTRNAPTLLYAALIPAPSQAEASPTLDADEAGQIGGLFLDGRAVSLEDQAYQPFFNPLEMNLANEADLANRLRTASYAQQMKNLLRPEAWSNDHQVVLAACAALAHFLREPAFALFNAPIDRFIAGDDNALTPQQERGMNLFLSSHLQCNECHLFEGRLSRHPLFTDFSFANVGLPNRFEKPDPGLGAITGQALERGRFRTPTLRNVAVTSPYMHDGSLETLEDVLEFYNTRDVDPARWGAPIQDFIAGIHVRRIGNLRLSGQDIADLAAFLESLTDQPWQEAATANRAEQTRLRSSRK